MVIGVPTGPVACILLAVDYIDAEIEATLQNVLVKTRGKVGEVRLVLGAIGGQSWAAHRLYDLLLGWNDAPITIHATALTASAGITLLLAGGRRVATPASAFGFHGTLLDPRKFMERNDWLTKADLEGEVAEMQAQDDLMARQLRDRCALLDESELGALLGQKVIRTPEWALSVGLIHQIAPIRAPRNGLFFTISRAPSPTVPLMEPPP